MKDKLRIIFIPFVLALIGLTIGYSLLHWILFINLNLFSLKEIVTKFVIPLILTGLTSWFFLSPKLKILNLEGKRGSRLPDFYSFIAWCALSIPLIIAQEYVLTATGKLTELNSIKEINNYAPTKYYTIKTYYIDKQAAEANVKFDVSGKHNENFIINIYFAVPVLENENDTLSANEPLAWLGIKYHNSVSNNLDDEEKTTAFQYFSNACYADFQNKNISWFTYLDRIGNSEDRDGYLGAIKQNPAYAQSKKTIFVEVNEPFEARNGNKLQWIFGSALIGTLVWFIMLLFPKIDEKQLRRVKAGKPDKEAQKERRDFIDSLKPKEGYFITPILMYINAGIFLLMVIMGLGFISFDAKDLLSWGANYGPLTKNGEWWRLLTCTFVHGGIMHIFANMFGLWYVGIFLEPLLGRAKYLTAYLLTGILASLTSIWWRDASVSVGASGAIFGLYGVFLALLLTKIYSHDFKKSFFISTLIFVGLNLLNGLTGNIDNAAHIGGLLSGFVVGFILYPTLKRQTKI